MGYANVSIRIDFMGWNGSTIINETITNYSLHSVVAESLPMLTLQVEQNLTEFTSGDVSLVCSNADGWWDSPAFSAAYSDPTLRFPLCSYVNIYQDGNLVFQGDVDYKTVKFKRFLNVFGAEVGTVEFTALGALNRLSQYSAEVVRRSTPAFADTGYATGSGIDSGNIQESVAALRTPQRTGRSVE